MKQKINNIINEVINKLEIPSIYKSLTLLVISQLKNKLEQMSDEELYEGLIGIQKYIEHILKGDDKLEN